MAILIVYLLLLFYMHISKSIGWCGLLRYVVEHICWLIDGCCWYINVARKTCFLVTLHMMANRLRLKNRYQFHATRPKLLTLITAVQHAPSSYFLEFSPLQKGEVGLYLWTTHHSENRSYWYFFGSWLFGPQSLSSHATCSI